MSKLLIHEVGLRDGLQMERETVPFETKVLWAQQLMDSGVHILQLGSFVHPKYVPQMADTDRLFSYFSEQENPRPVLSGLVLNEKGVERGLSVGVELFCMGVSASETHSLKNTRMAVSEALSRTIDMAGRVLEQGRRVQVSVQSAFGCGFEGPISEEQILWIVSRYLGAELKNLSLADTAGHANPRQVERLVSRIRKLDSSVQLTCHFHNTYGVGIANCMAALDAGVEAFESAFGGLGGCPFTAVAGGNVCTEDLVHLLQRMGYCREIELGRLIGVGKDAASFLGRELPGSVYRSGSIEANVQRPPVV